MCTREGIYNFAKCIFDEINEIFIFPQNKNPDTFFGEG